MFAVLAKGHAQDVSIAVIIDDVGHQRLLGQRAIELPGPVVIAVLPHTPFATVLASRAQALDKEVLVHMPMQPISSQRDPGPHALHGGLEEIEFRHRLRVAMQSLPQAIGISNHMGSRLTRDSTAMHWLMSELATSDSLMFVDSYTTHLSVGLMLARVHAVPALKRDVFIDVDPTPGAIATAWNRLVSLAKENGFAVGIAHPYEETLNFLESTLPLLDGVRLVPLRVLVKSEAKQRSFVEIGGADPILDLRSAVTSNAVFNGAAQ